MLNLCFSLNFHFGTTLWSTGALLLAMLRVMQCQAHTRDSCTQSLCWVLWAPALSHPVLWCGDPSSAGMSMHPRGHTGDQHMYLFLCLRASQAVFSGSQIGSMAQCEEKGCGGCSGPAMSGITKPSQPCSETCQLTSFWKSPEKSRGKRGECSYCVPTQHSLDIIIWT